MFVCWVGRCAIMSIYVEIRAQFEGTGSVLLPWGFWGSRLRLSRWAVSTLTHWALFLSDHLNSLSTLYIADTQQKHVYDCMNKWMGGVVIPNESGSSQRNYKSQCLCTWPEGSGFPVPCPLSGLGYTRFNSWELDPRGWYHSGKWGLDGDRLGGAFPSLVSFYLPLCFLATMRWQFSSSMSFCHDLLLHHNQEIMDPANHGLKSLKTGVSPLFFQWLLPGLRPQQQQQQEELMW